MRVHSLTPLIRIKVAIGCYYYLSSPKARHMKKNLVPAGGSKTDLVVFETALDVARPLDAHLEFLHVHLDASKPRCTRCTLRLLAGRPCAMHSITLRSNAKAAHGRQ